MKNNQYRAKINVALSSDYESNGINAKFISIPGVQYFTVLPMVGDCIEFGSPNCVDYFIEGFGIEKGTLFNHAVKVVTTIILCCNEQDEPLYDFSLLCVYETLA